MAQPGRTLGGVWVDVHANTDRVEPEMRAGLKKAGEDVEATEATKIGDDLGGAVGKSMGDRLEQEGPRLARRLERGIAGRTVKTTFRLDRDNNVVETWVTETVKDIEKAFDDASSKGGPLNRVGQTISDAIGAGFNVSGRSPLIALLIPVVGIIVELVLAAIQAASAVTALLTLLPSLVTAIGIQVGVLFLAFHGLGTAIQGAFAATNADELQKALEGLTPAAQTFVRSLLPLRDLLKQLSTIAQQQFFAEFGNSITVLANKLGPWLINNVGGLAESLGRLARTLVTFGADPAFIRFFTFVMASTNDWINSFSIAIEELLRGLVDLGDVVRPLFDWFGQAFNDTIAEFGRWLQKISTDKDFLAWLDQMKESLKLVWLVLGDAVALIYTLANTLNKAGGNDLLKQLADQLEALIGFFSSDTGQKAIEGLIHTVEALSWVFVALVIGIGLVLTGFEVLLEWLKHTAGPWIADFFTRQIPQFFEFVGTKIMGFFTFLGTQITSFVNWIGVQIMNFFTFIGTGVTDFVNWIPGALGAVIGAIVSFLFLIVGAVTTWVHDRIQDILGFFGDLWDHIVGFFGNLWNVFYDAGKNLIQGLINGMLGQLGAVAGAIGRVVQEVKDHIPHSPAKKGPLSGEGDPMKGGARIVDRLAAGMEMAQPTLTDATNGVVGSINFGAGSIVQNFNGVPTATQAAGIGRGVGDGISSRLSTRDTVLAVRAM